MANFGELVLVLGDMHIPQRARAIPEKFKRMLVPGKMQHVLCTGNIGSEEQYEELQDLAPNVHLVEGDFEDQSALSGPPLEEFKVIQVGLWKIGLVHGHQIVPWSNSNTSSLARWKRKLQDCDILVSGHVPHNVVRQVGGSDESSFWHINPGSITGAYTSVAANENEIVPSFCLLAIQGPKVVCYVYELSKDDDVKVTKTEFEKKED